jgi:hypothetical protein
MMTAALMNSTAKAAALSAASVAALIQRMSGCQRCGTIHGCQRTCISGFITLALPSKTVEAGHAVIEAAARASGGNNVQPECQPACCLVHCSVSQLHSSVL